MKNITAQTAIRQVISIKRKSKRSKRFLFGREVAELARELSIVLRNVKENITNSRTGVEITAEFFRLDSTLFAQCDDSNGNLGDVFRFDGRDLFVHFGSLCDDKQWLEELIFDLQQKDEYGIRDILVDSAAQVLPEGRIRFLIKPLLEALGQRSQNL